MILDLHCRAVHVVVQSTELTPVPWSSCCKPEGIIIQYPDTMTIAEGENVGAAIGLVCVAGAASAVGASVVFFPSLVKRASHRVLAASLGLSAGVMIYVCFVEILFKSVGGFVSAGMGSDKAYTYATLSFFGGVMMMMVRVRERGIVFLVHIDICIYNTEFANLSQTLFHC